jgi:hypothetical protein
VGGAPPLEAKPAESLEAALEISGAEPVSQRGSALRAKLLRSGAQLLAQRLSALRELVAKLRVRL